jgi:hypothetical protein
MGTLQGQRLERCSHNGGEKVTPKTSFAYSKFIFSEEQVFNSMLIISLATVKLKEVLGVFGPFDNDLVR